MKFSIASIILLTFWASLGVLYLDSGRRQAVVAQQMAATKAATKDALLRVDVETRRDHPAVIQRFTAKAEDYSRLHDAMKLEFEAAAEELGVVEPVEKVAIRNMPMIGRHQWVRHYVRVHVPASEAIIVDLRLAESDSRQGRNSPRTTITGDDLTHPLPPGMHTIGCEYDYRPTTAKPNFKLIVDGEIVAEYVCDRKVSGYGSSYPNYFKQHNFRPRHRLPSIFELRPSTCRQEIQVSLKRAKAQS